MAQKTKDLTIKYFKTVGVEIARHMCDYLSDATNNFNSDFDAVKNTENSIDT